MNTSSRRPGDRFGDHFLRAALAVHFSRIDEVEAAIEPLAQDGGFLASPGNGLAHVPGAQSQRRDALTIGQRDVFHDRASSGSQAAESEQLNASS
jgi:hypothetical protein